MLILAMITIYGIRQAKVGATLTPLHALHFICLAGRGVSVAPKEIASPPLQVTVTLEVTVTSGAGGEGRFTHVGIRALRVTSPFG